MYFKGLLELFVPPFKLYLIAYSIASHLAVNVTSFAMFQSPSLTLLEPLYQPAKSKPSLVGFAKVVFSPYITV